MIFESSNSILSFNKNLHVTYIRVPHRRRVIAYGIPFNQILPPLTLYKSIDNTGGGAMAKNGE